MGLVLSGAARWGSVLLLCAAGSRSEIGRRRIWFLCYDQTNMEVQRGSAGPTMLLSQASKDRSLRAFLATIGWHNAVGLAAVESV